MDFEFAFRSLWGIATAAGWFWVHGISKKHDKIEADIAKVRNEMVDIRLGYSTKQEAQADRKNLLDALTRLETKLDKMNDKLDKKADKS